MTHKIWQNINLMALGFLLGQIIPAPTDFLFWMIAVCFVSGILEQYTNKRDVSGWRNPDFKLK